jgi:hypothetical protein
MPQQDTLLQLCVGPQPQDIHTHNHVFTPMPAQGQNGLCSAHWEVRGRQLIYCSPSQTLCACHLFKSKERHELRRTTLLSTPPCAKPNTPSSVTRDKSTQDRVSCGAFQTPPRHDARQCKQLAVEHSREISNASKQGRERAINTQGLLFTCVSGTRTPATRQG